MGHETTITEQDMDAAAQQFVQEHRQDKTPFEPDLSVDGLSESLLSRLFGLFAFRKS